MHSLMLRSAILTALAVGWSFVLFSPLANAQSAQTPAELQTFQEAADSIAKSKGKESIGRDIADKYSRHGSKFEGRAYEEHPWYNGNPAWLAAWMAEDTVGLMEDFFSCLELTILGPCGPCCIYIEFWWPEIVGEANNFCIGAFLSGQLRPVMTTTKEAMMPLVLGGMDMRRSDYPNELGEEPHVGQSHVDDTGFFPGQRVRNYESRLYRSFLDLATAIADIPCWSQCIPPVEEFALNYSELLSPMWRIPELSVLRPLDNDKYADLYGELPLLALVPGWGALASGVNPLELRPYLNVDVPDVDLSGMPALVEELTGGGVALKTTTCASYRAAKMNNEIPLHVRVWPTELENMDKLCYHQSLGQLYPLTGDIEVNSEVVGPVGGIRRIFEWGSMDVWGDFFRSNYYNDFKGENLYRRPSSQKTKKGNRKADKLQRLFPEPSECYKVKDVDERDHDLWPKGLIEEEDLGDRRVAHWNRRRCCICACPSCFEIPTEE